MHILTNVGARKGTDMGEFDEQPSLLPPATPSPKLLVTAPTYKPPHSQHQISNPSTVQVDAALGGEADAHSCMGTRRAALEQPLSECDVRIKKQAAAGRAALGLGGALAQALAHFDAQSALMARQVCIPHRIALRASYSTWQD